MGYIYKITNTISSKCYIGETAKEDPEIRWNQHKGTIRRGAGCPAFRDAVNKYGIDKFKFEVLIICFDDNRFEMEKLYIKKYNSQAPNGYNISAGGMGGNFTGRKHTPETMARIIETTRLYRQNNPDWFEKYREKHKQVMSKVDISAAMKKSEKWQRANSNGRVRIKVNKYDDNNNLLESYYSIKRAAGENNIPYSTLSTALKHNRKAGGFIWKKMPKEPPTCHIVE